MAFGFPTFVQLLATPEAAAYDRSSLEIIVTGGMVLTPQYYDTMMTLPNMKFVLNGYGMTECGALATTVDLSGTDGYRAIPNVPHLSVGRLYPNTSLKVLDVETGRALGPNEKGELVVRSPIMSIGYWQQPHETQSTFADGWLRTGDLGYYDQNGFIFVIDRIKETFKYFNNHVSHSKICTFLFHLHFFISSFLHPAVASMKTTLSISHYVCI
jgi:acyl-CoA synthetase (AMP-forming)/AMP-acid ligase II